MGQWHKTGCVLCAQNCGLEAWVEDGRMTKVRPDKDNARSQGYACRKGLNVLYHQYQPGRLTTPLKKVDGEFQPISWDQAATEIAEKIGAVVGEHGPRALAYMGGSAQGGHFEAAFGLSIIRSLGSRYFYSSAGQEFSGAWWVNGRMLGKQYLVPIPDEHQAEVMVAWGWNGMMSHQIPQTRRTLSGFAKDPKRMLVAVDPRKSETAAIADMHVAVRPGADALLIKAMIAYIVEQGREHSDYLAQQVVGWEEIKPLFQGVDVQAALEVCAVEPDQVRELCRVLTTRTWCLHPDLGIYMGRQGTLSYYLLMVLQAVCGCLGVRGGNLLPGMLMPLGSHNDERDPKVWRTMTTDVPPAAAGAFPPAVVPEEILSDHPQRLRAMLVSACNPLRAYPDTQAYEEAFGKLDLLVVNDVVMTETARLAHYVLPCRSFYEAWDGTFFPLTYPGIFFQLRRPLVDPPSDCKEAGQIFTLIADKLGLIPDIPDDLVEAAKGNRLAFGMKLMAWAQKEPKAMKAVPLVLAQTLGKAWDSAALAALWGMLMTAPKAFVAAAQRQGFAPGPDLGDRLFQHLMDHPEGAWIGQADPEQPLAGMKTDSGRIEMKIPELLDDLAGLNAESEAAGLELPPEMPLILCAGRHMDYNANTNMRDPAWNKGKRACTVAISPDNASDLGLSDGQQVTVTTQAGQAQGELQVTGQVRPGMVLIPHGFGLILEDGGVYGLNVNRLTHRKNRDWLGTPLHRFIPCRLEAA